MAIPASLRAQVPVLRLAPASAVLDAELTRVEGIRELADGRVLISDAGENALFVADLRTQRVHRIGRVGRGPGEYLHVGRLYALPGDSTLMLDPSGARRWLVLWRDTIARTIPPDDESVAATGGAPRGVSAGGAVLFTRHARQVRTAERLLDSVYAIVHVPGATKRDTIARIAALDQRITVMGTQRQPFYILQQAHLSTIDLVAMSADGWVAVATQSPYRVTWRTPEGRIIKGPVLPWPRVAVDARERRAYHARRERASPHPSRARDNEWATTVPPFGGLHGILHTPDGRLLLRKMPWSGAEGTRYDVIDRTGRIVATMEMGENEWLVGFGASSAYRVVRDEDGFQRLQRHAWPPAP